MKKEEAWKAKALSIERAFHDALESIAGFMILLAMILDAVRVIVVSPNIYNWRDMVLTSGNAGFVELTICDFIQWLHSLQPYLRLTS